ncbi:hypothetical protein EBBID32_45140 [Sphingobium indicum BiD32]|uniref:Right handed beta helix domain-containing protein n=1 Tax=Sphingobium indicum BiD32 TaxID=1301087 RepID=N1MY13_9SPHN|nr:hypothetical protein [Sphingobium indicum]CCW20143.1 hypothetical protein EBBID32_45140 [Sphingobium indicum BiD32]
MTIAASLSRALAALRPGDTFVLPDGDIIGNIVLPRALSGAKGRPIMIRGGERTRIIAQDNRKAALGGGGCKWLWLRGIATVGGLNGFQFSQNGDAYDPASMIEQIYLTDCHAADPVDDCFKFNGGREAHMNLCSGRGGRDQIVDFLGIQRGSIRRSAFGGATCAITCKGGTQAIEIRANDIRACVDGIHYGERTAPRWQAPWTERSAERITIVNNDIAVTGNPIALAKGADADVAQLLRDNRLTTTKRAKGQMARLVEVYG